MIIVDVHYGYGRNTYKVILEEKDLQKTDQELVQAADGGNGYFGGYVSRDKEKATIVVYTD